MPWFPDFVAAVELARRESRTKGQVDPVGQYLTAIEHGDLRALETVWPGEVLVFDPDRGDIRGHRRLSFSAGGGIGLELCCITDDDVELSVEPA